MSLDSAIHALSNVNAILGSAVGYTEAKQNGASTGEALTGFGLNIMNGAMRNEVAKNIKDYSGSYLGYAINSIAGYGNNEANAKGTMGLLGASMLTSPFGIFGYGFNPYMTSSIYGCGPYGGGYWSGSFFGGGGCTPFMFGGPTMFGMRGCWC